jgi:thymidylate synthase (FAD)
MSRACSHQLVRHRLASYSQKSQRYVKESQFEYVIPPQIKNLGDDSIYDFKKQMSIIQGMYEYWKSKGIKNEDARFVLPNACTTQIGMTTNFREWRSIFELRCDRHAQWEIREMCCKILEILYSNAPKVFEDQYNKFIKG